MSSVKIKLTRPTVVKDVRGDVSAHDVGDTVEVTPANGKYLVAVGKAVLVSDVPVVDAPPAGGKDLDQAKNRAVDTGKPPVSRRASKGA